jgi:hypothetical protein
MNQLLGDPVIVTLAVYSWPFFFSAVVGLLIWIWKERVTERAAREFEATVNKVRVDIERRVGRIEQHMFGEDGDNGLRGDVREMMKKLNRLSLALAIWANREGVELPREDGQ